MDDATDYEKLARQLQEQMLWAGISNVDPTDEAAVSRRHHFLIAEALRGAAAAEREACAALIEERATQRHGCDKHEDAAALRARGGASPDAPSPSARSGATVAYKLVRVDGADEVQGALDRHAEQGWRLRETFQSMGYTVALILERDA
jgi:hypothetical protein